jgi:glutathione S-transferase
MVDIGTLLAHSFVLLGLFLIPGPAVLLTLARSTYFAGPEFTAADIMMVFPLTTMRAATGRSLGASPHLRAYLTRIGERPA